TSHSVRSHDTIMADFYARCIQLCGLRPDSANFFHPRTSHHVTQHAKRTLLPGGPAWLKRFLVRSRVGSYTDGMTGTQDPDPREELRRRLDSGEITTDEANRALAVVDREGDVAALRAAERPGTLSAEETGRQVDSWGLDDEIAEMMERLGLESASS